MKWSIGTKIGSGFGLALAVLMVVSAVSYNSTTKLIDSAEWVRHTHEVINGLDEVVSAFKDAETGQRGYIITGEARYRRSGILFGVGDDAAYLAADIAARDSHRLLAYRYADLE
jgi:hypothetical protein